MAEYTENYNLSMPEQTDTQADFIQAYRENMGIIDENMGGGGGGSSTLAGLTDVSITTPVTGDALIYDGAEWANTPLADVATSGDYTDLINTPSLATVATTGDYGDLLNTPSLATVATSGQYSDLSGTPNLATVATSGSYTDLSNKPTIPTALSDLSDDSTHRVVTDTQISTWNGKSDFSGSYNDLTDKPTIPTVNDGTLTIQQNGTTLGTFTANQSGNTTVNLSGGGGSAHTIVNESGTALADEPNLQFTDGLTATDDSVNTKTKVGVDTTFTESATRTNIASGDSLATIFGKIKKWFSDLPGMFVSKSGDTMSGDLTIDLQNGTTSNIGASVLTVGNNISRGTDKNSEGVIQIYSNTQWWANLKASGLTSPREYNFPDKFGTIALTSDIPSNPATMETFFNSNSNTYTVTIPSIVRHNFLIVTPVDIVTVCTYSGSGDVSSAVSMKGYSVTVSGNDVTVAAGSYYRSVMLIY